jgi:tRNA nucleotidyltransferase (CCA-adding enzyme)
VDQRRVRVLHARSFIDDPTRIFRCIRFATRLGFRIESQTLDLMRSAVEQRLPAFLTPERILYELRLICAEPLVLPTVKILGRERVLEAAWRWTPPRGFLAGMAKLLRSRIPPDLIFIYWLSVLPVTDRFPIRKPEREAAEAVASAAKLKPRLKRKLRPSQILQTLRAMPEPALRILAVLESKTVSRSIRAFLESYSQVRIATTGADLRGAGLKPGPAFRRILDELLFARLDGRIRTVTEERALLQRLARQEVG